MEELNCLQQEENGTIEVIATSSVKKRKCLLFAIIGIILVVAVVGTISIIVMGDDERKIREQLDLGAKYLEELNYEQAILQYKLVLEIDIQNKEALTKISEVYGLRAEAETEYAKRMEAYNMAIEYALSAYEYYPEDVALREMLVNTYMNAGEYCLENEGLADAEKYYTQAKEWAEKFSMTDKISQIDGKMAEIEQIKKEIEEAKEKEEAEAKAEADPSERLLKPIYEAYQVGDRGKVIKLLWEQELNDLLRNNGLGYLQYGERDENGNINGFLLTAHLDIEETDTSLTVQKWENGECINGVGELIETWIDDNGDKHTSFFEISDDNIVKSMVYDADGNFEFEY